MAYFTLEKILTSLIHLLHLYFCTMESIKVLSFYVVQFKLSVLASVMLLFCVACCRISDFSNNIVRWKFCEHIMKMGFEDEKARIGSFQVTVILFGQCWRLILQVFHALRKQLRISLYKEEFDSKGPWEWQLSPVRCVDLGGQVYILMLAGLWKIQRYQVLV